MATYQPIPVGGYTPIGALAGLYAGQNVAQQEQQNQMANLADLINAYNMKTQAETGQFNLEQSRLKGPNELALSNLAGAQALQMNTPEALAAYRSGTMGGWQSNAAKGAVDTALQQSAIDVGKSKGLTDIASNKFREAYTHIDNIANFAKQSPLLAANYINNTITDPEKRDEYLRLVSSGQIHDLQKHFALKSIEHQQRMDIEKLKATSEEIRANTLAQGQVNAANKQLEAAKLSEERLNFQAAETAAKTSVDVFKTVNDDLKNQLDKFKPEQKQSQEYKDLKTMHSNVRQQMLNASQYLIDLRNKRANQKDIQPTVQPTPAQPTQPVPTPQRSVIQWDNLQ